LTNSTNSTLLCFIPEVLWFKNTRLKKHIKKEVALERKNGFCWWFFFDSFHCCICNVLGEYQCTAKHCKLDDVGTLRYFRFCNQFFGGQQKSMASFVICILFSKSGWKWGFVETVSAVGSGIALVVWRKLGPRSAIVAIVVAMVISSIPAVRDAWGQINSEGWWYWAGISFCSVLSCYGAKAWTIEDRLFPVASFVFNLGMTTILFL